MTAIHHEPAVIDACATVIRELRELAPSLVFASVITDDGFEVAHGPNDAFDSGRLASMTSSVQALGDAVARELAMGANEYVVMALAGGHLLQLRVPEQPLILAALFDNHELLGKGLSVSRRSVERLGALLAAL
jgi:predicted regulator of Ras-like GTPase activity (Roadblock/LC7/MglB family)